MDGWRIDVGSPEDREAFSVALEEGAVTIYEVDQSALSTSAE